MALKARKWTPVDREVAELFAAKRMEDLDKYSYRTLGEMTGLTHMRVRDILNQDNGAPTLSEYLALCSAFDINAAKLLDRLAAEADQTEDYALVASEDPDKIGEAETPDD